MTASRLADKVAVVTGGGSGIGREIALAYARERASVVVTDHDGKTAEACAEAIRAAGGRAEALRVDVRSSDEVQAMVALAREAFGDLHILVNSAGIGEQVPFLQQSVAEFERIVAINLTGSYRCAHAAAPAMVEAGWGRIVNIASIAGLQGVSGRVSYGSSKHGVVGMTRALAIELAPHGITVNAIAPGPIDTPMAQQIHTAATRETYLRNIPFRRFGAPADVAHGAVFLASEEAAYITGHTLPVDGGMNTTAAMFELGPA